MLIDQMGLLKSLEEAGISHSDLIWFAPRCSCGNDRRVGLRTQEDRKSHRVQELTCTRSHSYLGQQQGWVPRPSDSHLPSS